MLWHEDEEIAVVNIAHKYVAQEDLLLLCVNIYESNFYEEVQVLC